MIGIYFSTVWESVRRAWLYMSASVLFVSAAELNCIHPVFFLFPRAEKKKKSASDGSQVYISFPVKGECQGRGSVVSLPITL